MILYTSTQHIGTQHISLVILAGPTGKNWSLGDHKVSLQPGETRSFVETSGVRVGTAAETTRGHSEQWFTELARQMIALLRNAQ